MKDEKKKYKISELSRDQITRAKRYYWNNKKIKEGSGATFAAYSKLRFEEDAFRW